MTACRTLVHLWMTRTPCCLKYGMCGAGLRPAVSTMVTPDSTIAARYSSYGGGLIDGSVVRFTPNGLSVISRHRAISAVNASGVGCVSAVRMPRPPAFDTAAAISARPTHCMPPCTTGCSMPISSVNLVTSI